VARTAPSHNLTRSPKVGCQFKSVRGFESGRRRGYPRRPPTPPGIRFRTKAVPAKPLCFCPIACLPISARTVYPTPTASADFYQPIPSLCNDGSTWQVGRSPRVRRATFIPYTRRIYFYIFRVIIGLWILLPPRPDVAASMRFLFVGPGLCLQLPSDSTSR
jgi:hypothetical protein